MLKWTVKARRQRYLQGLDNPELPSAQEQEMVKQRLKTSGLMLQDEDDQYNSPPCENFADHSLLQQLESLKDSSSGFHTPKRVTSTRTSVNLLKTPDSTTSQQYSSTLPTFDVEDSPSSLMPGRPSRVLLPKGLQDAYFKNPRYLTNNHMLFG